MTDQEQAQEQVATATDQNLQHDQQDQSKDLQNSNVRPTEEQEKNWREVRRIMQEQRQKIEELESRVSSQPRQEEKDEFEELSPDDVVTVADMKRYAAKVAKSTAQELYEEQRKKQEIDSIPSKYPDYQDVIQYVEPLVKENPALLGAIQNAPNPREAAYQIAKMYVSNRSDGKEKAEKIAQNLSQPRTTDTLSTQSSVDSLSARKSLTIEEKAKIWEQAQRYAGMR